MNKVSNSITETKEIAKEFVESMKKEGKNIVLLSGNLGVGKTIFCKCIGGLLGVNEREITSPTFVLRKDYATKDSTFKKMIHIDLYRIEDEKELKTIDWEGVCGEKMAIVLVEWGEMVSDRCKNAKMVNITLNGEKRIFEI